MKYLKFIRNKMGLSKDIINIVRCIKSKYEKKRINRKYHEMYSAFDNIYYRYGIYLRYKYASFAINYRDLISRKYRKEIACFLTNTRTKYEVPKNY